MRLKARAKINWTLDIVCQREDGYHLMDMLMQPVTLADDVTLNVTTTFAGEDGNAQNFKDAVAAWEEETGNKVNDASATSDESFKARVEMDFQTGADPDVLFFFNGCGKLFSASGTELGAYRVL